MVGALPTLCRPGKRRRLVHGCAVNKWGNYAEHCDPQNWLNLILETTLITRPGPLGRVRGCFLAASPPQGESSTPSSDTGGKSSGLSNLHQLHGQLSPPVCNRPDTQCFQSYPSSRGADPKCKVKVVSLTATAAILARVPSEPLWYRCICFHISINVPSETTGKRYSRSSTRRVTALLTPRGVHASQMGAKCSPPDT